jgi:hypothetical protein
VKISKSDLKRALIAAEAERSKYPTVFRPDPTQHPELLSTLRAGEKLFSEFFRKAGLDEKKLAELQKQHNTELRRILDKYKAEAVKHASSVKDTIHSSIKSQSEALKLLAADNSFFPFPSFSLEKPLLILATPHSNIIWDSNIAPFDSWAKIRVDSTESSGSQKVSFDFLWNNPSNFFAVINANTFMSASGLLEATGLWRIVRDRSHGALQLFER